jgi:CHASE2 domain-containing sensor protein/signal transduction histidine kinase
MLLVTGLVLGRFTERLDYILYDNALSSSERDPPDDIVVVAIDNRSLQAIGRWPWPRRVHAQALDRLAEARPRAVGYDVLFVEPTPDDAILAAAIKRNRTYLPLVIDVPGRDGAAYDIALPSGPLLPAAAGVAQVNLHFDGDRVIRKAFLEEGGDGRSWLQLAALMAGLKPERDGAADKLGLWQERPILIPYGGSAGHVRTISFIDLLDGQVPPQIFANRNVLIGATADGMGDSYPTPTSGTTSVMAGVEIQAHMLDALLRASAITPVSDAWVLALAAAVLGILLLGFLRLSPRGNANLAVGLAVAVLLLSFGLFRFGQIWLPPAAALIGLLFVYPLWGWRRLQAISTYMTNELRLLQSEGDAFPRQERATSQREVTLQATLLGQAIDRLRDLRRFLSDALGRLPDAIYVTDLHGEISLANAEGRRLSERLGAPSHRGADIRHILVKFRSTTDEATLSPFTPGAPDLGGGEAATEDGGNFEIRYVAQCDASDAQVGWIIRIVDISPLKQAERHREDALQLLSHDMRAPQSAILALLRGPEARVPKAVRIRIEGLAKRTLDLAEDFVQLARAEAKPLEIEPVDLNDIAIDAADALWPTAKARSIKVDVEGIDDFHMVDGDRQLLTRAVINLIGNAIKYSDDGTHIRCGLSQEGGHIRLTIADQGIGMTEEQLSKLFARFQRGSREGVGLGLAFVRTVIDRHNGTIDCKSAPGKGTTFTIDLVQSEEKPYGEY